MSAQKERTTSQARRGADDETATASLARQRHHLQDQIDGLLEEIDELLEQNAEEFLKGYVQQGGQ